MADRETIIAAQDAWSDAEKAYGDEFSRYFKAALLAAPDSGNLHAEPLTGEARQELRRLREAADAAMAAYYDVVG